MSPCATKIYDLGKLHHKTEFYFTFLIFSQRDLYWKGQATPYNFSTNILYSYPMFSKKSSTVISFYTELYHLHLRKPINSVTKLLFLVRVKIITTKCPLLDVLELQE